MGFSETDITKIKQLAMQYKKELITKYGNDDFALQGKCIEASDELVSRLKKLGYNTGAKQVYVLYENFESCSNYCYEEHWLCLILKGGQRLYLDITMNQFQWAFSKKLPLIYLKHKLPNFYLVHKPGKTILDRCGWNDWYNTGNYINNFDYYKG